MNTLSPELQSFLSIVVQGIIPILGGLLVSAVAYLATVAVTYLKAHLSQVQLLQAKTIIDFLVTSAQQSGLTGALESDGAAKKQWVFDEAVKWLNSAGLSTFAGDASKIEQLIETSVYELHNIKTPPLFDDSPVTTLG